MIRSEVPGWALMYARHIHQLDRAGQLDSNDPAYRRYETQTPPVSRLSPQAGFIAAVVFLIGTLGGALALARGAAECNGQFPPCVSSDETSGPRGQR